MSASPPPDPAEVGQPLSARAIATVRNHPTAGMSRRSLLRRSLGLGVGVAALEGLLGMLSFVWPKTARGSARVRVGTLDDLIALNGSLPIDDGFPAYVADARAFVITIDPSRGSWNPGADPTGDGTALNVRALSQRCPHLGCRPNPCLEDFWFRCPCHQSRYDRLGTKADGVLYGPAARSMDRYPIEVDGSGVLTIDTSRVNLGPLPVVLGQPGLIPPRVPNGCT
jgi:cytochrome b6-f complex iron-sulfur subunit